MFVRDLSTGSQPIEVFSEMLEGVFTPVVGGAAFDTIPVLEFLNSFSTCVIA